MLKGFVSGEEKDIVRILMKGRNLSEFDATTYLNDNAYYVSNRILNSIPAGSYTLSYFVDVDPSVGSFAASVGVGSTIASYEKDIKTVNDIVSGYVNIPFSITDADDGKKLFVRFVRSGSRFTATVTVTKVMLNSGSTALPYEPYGYQEGWEVRDNQDRLIWGREDELQTATGTLPFKGYALPVKPKSLLGNTVQNGTPAPDSIITPEMCGVRTEQLIRPDMIFNKSAGTTNGAYPAGEGGNRRTAFACVAPNTSYTFSIGSQTTDRLVIAEYNRIVDPTAEIPSEGLMPDNVIYTINTQFSGSKTFQTGSSAKMVMIYYALNAAITNPMLNPGSTALPYEPYGWKLSLTNAGQTIPIYLGEVPTVRRVRKLVLTGEETFYKNDPSNPNNSLYYQTGYRANEYCFCTHITNMETLSASKVGVFNANSVLYLNLGVNVMNAQPSGNTVAGLKEYLAAQYAAGHPVTIWYVLANEQTGIVNEPLAKIGTYADELTTIQAHGLSAPLYGIGDYKDTLNLSTGVVTRKVGKLVLTGTEEIRLDTAESNRTVYFLFVNNFFGNFGFCTHIEWKSPYRSTEYDRIVYVQDGRLFISISNAYLSAQTVQAFKSYLAAQYQAGTPVTLWYILATPTTETVTVPTGMTGEIEGYLTQVSTPTPTNRSVPKWNGVEETGGTYAVTVYTPPEIPTTTGENALTVETEKIHGLTNPLCGIGDYKDVLNLSTGVITRKVKKLVLDGTESLWGSGTSTVYLATAGTANVMLQFSTVVSSHYTYHSGGTSRAPNNSVYTNAGAGTAIWFKTDYGNDVDSFKSYLAAQYQAGTPVTIWYVLETPETETITVPYGLECSVEGYLTQSGTPSPSSPITPDSNGILESGGTYAVEVSLVPSSLTVKGHIKELT